MILFVCYKSICIIHPKCELVVFVNASKPNFKEKKKGIAVSFLTKTYPVYI